jgi:hypothetical protein
MRTRFIVTCVGIMALLGVTLGDALAADVHKKGEGDDLRGILETLRRIESRLDALEKTVTAGAAAPESRATGLPDPPAGAAAVKVTWEYRDIHGQIETYEAPVGAKLWETRTYKPGARIETGAPVKDELLWLVPGRPKLAILVYRNPLPKEQTFYVIPHVADPVQQTANLDYKCLCTGDRYTVPANGAWSRVIEYKVAPKVKPGEKIYTWMVAVGEH